jgi:ATP-dependent exoDNAse (exonuclease V) beta subunit
MDEESYQFIRKMEALTLADFSEFIKILKNKVKKAEQVILYKAQTALGLIDNAGLDAGDFAGGQNSIAGYFNKMSAFSFDKNFPAKKTPDKTIEEDKWYSSKANATQKHTIDGIKAQLKQLYLSLQQELKHYVFFKMLHSKIYSLALAKEIRGLLTDFTARTQKVHISEFNKKISDEIAGQPVPFIYERLGSKYRYFLIDEFQDTSILQWQNLLPLIEESLSYNHFNMLVGDTKQAIYRFRNGEVELFSSLPEIYQHDGSALMQSREKMLKDHYQEVILDVNYRSLSEVVAFNNDFFEVIKPGLSERLLQIYKSHQQQLPKGMDKSDGFVKLDLIEAENKEDFAQQRLAVIKHNIDELLEARFRMQDICILTRTNESAVEIAGFLLAHQLKVVSSESLLLTNSPDVRLVVAFFKLLLLPDEKLMLAEFVQQLIEAGRAEGTFHELFIKALQTDGNFLSSISPYFKKGSSFKSITGRPVYEMAEFTVRNLLQSEKVDVFLQYFLDFVFKAQEAGKETLDDFIDLWEEKKKGLYISMPSGSDAIQIMTVHKAKGLKFEAVIADLYNSSNRKTKTEYWLELNDMNIPDLEGLTVGLLPLTSELESIDLKAVFDEETDKNKLDFLNLIYVAFTRPVQALFAVGHANKRDKFGAYIRQYIDRKMPGQEGSLAYTLGRLAFHGKRKEKKDGKKIALEKMISTAWEDLIRIAPSDELYWELLGSKPATTYGKLVHAMLAKVQYAEDVETVVKQYQLSGMIDKQEAAGIKPLMDRVVQHPDLKRFFSRGILVKNETELLDANAKLQRPDRVVIDGDKLCVIDYKTGEKSESHKKQIADYADAFRRLGYGNVVARLVYLNEAVEVVDV